MIGFEQYLREGAFRRAKTRIGKALPDRVRKGLAAAYIAGRSIDTAARGHKRVASRMRQKAVGYLKGRGKLPENTCGTTQGML